MRSIRDIPAAITLLSIILFFTGTDIFADTEFSGFLDTYHSLRVTKPNDFLSSRTRLRGDLFMSKGKGSIFFSLKVMQSSVIEPCLEFELREAYLEYSFKIGEIRVGRQIVAWGNSERVQISDLVSPFDLREFIARDYEDMRMGVDSLQLRLFWEKVKFDLIWIPFFRRAKLPEEGDPWYLGEITGGEMEYNSIDLLTPARNLKNSEFFGKMSIYLAGIDMGFFKFLTWSDIPHTVLREYSEENIESHLYSWEFSRLEGTGVELSKPYDFAVLRGEIVFLKGRKFQKGEPYGEVVERNSLKWLVGVDFFLRGEFKVSLQFMDDIIFNYSDDIIRKPYHKMGTLNISKKFFRNILSFSNFTYFSLKWDDFYNRSQFDLALSDEFHLIFGSDFFWGDGENFGKYRKNSQVWIKLKYMF